MRRVQVSVEDLWAFAESNNVNLEDNDCRQVRAFFIALFHRGLSQKEYRTELGMGVEVFNEISKMLCKKFNALTLDILKKRLIVFVEMKQKGEIPSETDSSALSEFNGYTSAQRKRIISRRREISVVRFWPYFNPVFIEALCDKAGAGFYGATVLTTLVSGKDTIESARARLGLPDGATLIMELMKIAQGCGVKEVRDLERFLNIAYRSWMETPRYAPSDWFVCAKLGWKSSNKTNL